MSDYRLVYELCLIALNNKYILYFLIYILIFNFNLSQSSNKIK